MWERAAVLNCLYVPGFGNDLSSGNPSSFSHCDRAFNLGYSTLQQLKIGGTVSLMGTYQLLHPMERRSRHMTLGPNPHMLISKALCSIRVEQEDIQNLIDDSLKMRHSTLAKQGLVIINIGFLIGILINFMVRR
nr:PREDICTED: uncharacterized protein LOC103984983 isoform X2 [Musa acuminata subsp. malaccensis]